MLEQQPEGSERLTPGLRLMGLAIVPGAVPSGRISGRARLSAGPLEVVPDHAGGSTPEGATTKNGAGLEHVARSRRHSRHAGAVTTRADGQNVSAFQAVPCSRGVGWACRGDDEARGDASHVDRVRYKAPPVRRAKGSAYIVCCVEMTRMPTNLAIDDELLTEAQRVGGHRMKKDTVNEALEEYIQRRRQAKINDLFGTIEFESAYDYKKQRRRS
jgi:Arc/MetJ family transcription regulator